MSFRKQTNILVLMGVFDGHLTGIIEIIKELEDLGHNITCYVLEKYKNRIQNTKAKLKVFSIPEIHLPPNAPKISLNSYTLGLSYDAIISDALKSNEKYDYLLIDSFFDGNEINKIFKIPIVISVYIFPLGKETPFVKKTENFRMKSISQVNKKYNLNLRDFLRVHYDGDTKYKLMLTSKLFHPESKLIDESFYFIGPSIEEKKDVDINFSFKKDENKKLIFISLGTIFNTNIDIFKKFIEAFGNSKEFQLIMSIGKYFQIKDLGDLPDNIFVFNYLPQLQILKQTDVFITHGGINSINEALLIYNLPVIIVPQELDQFENAKQIEKYGGGIILENKNLSPEIIKNTVLKFIENKEKYKIGVEKITQSYKEARKQRKEIYEKLFV